MKLRDIVRQGLELVTGAPTITNSDSALVASSHAEGMAQIFALPTTAAGTHVNPQSAMRVSTVYAAVRLLAGSVSVLPCNVYVYKDGWFPELQDPDNLWWLLNEQPNPRWTAAAMWEWIGASVLLHGDGYCWLRTNNNGKILEIHPLHPQACFGRRVGNELIYDVVEDGKTYGIPGHDMLHFAGFGYDGVKSMSAITYGAREAVGIAIAADDHAGRFYRGGTLQKYVLKTDGVMNTEQKELLRGEFANRYSRTEAPTTPLILTEGLDLTSISLSATDAQLLESRQYQVEDIARVLGVPPFMLGAQQKTTSWGSGVAEMGRGFLIYTLQPHLVRWQQELNRKLFQKAGKFIEFDTAALTMADAKTRSEAFRKAIGGSEGPGWMTVDEVRRQLRLKPMGGVNAELFRPTDAAAEAAKKSETKEDEGNEEPARDVQEDDAGQPSDRSRARVPARP